MVRETQRYYDRFSARYSSERRHGYFGWLNAVEVSAIAGAVPGRTVLELGCGTGLLLDRVRELSPGLLIGVDLSPGMLAEARKGGHLVACGSALQLPFADRSFDVVYSFKVLPHVPDLGTALAEAMRVTRDGGQVFAELYNPFSVKGLWDKLRGASRKVHLRHHAPSEVRAAAPPDCSVDLVAGIRIFGPVASAYEGRRGALMRRLDQWAMRGPLRFLAGYQVYRLTRSSGR